MARVENTVFHEGVLPHGSIQPFHSSPFYDLEAALRDALKGKKCPSSTGEVAHKEMITVARSYRQSALLSADRPVKQLKEMSGKPEV